MLDIENSDQLLENPIIGASWEGYAIENLISSMPKWKPSFFRSSNGAEVDLILERGGRQLVFECKASKAPKPSRGFYESIKHINPEACCIIASLDNEYMYTSDIKITNLQQCLKNLD